MSAVSSNPEDFVAGFMSDTLPIAGRVVRMGRGTLSPILHRHAYPDHLGQILGEGLILSTLVGAGMKLEGRVMTQAEGDGPVSMLVGEYRKDGGVRAYARFEQERWAYLEKINKGEKPQMPQLFGQMGRLGLIIVHDEPSLHPYQGLVSLDKPTLAECAEDYFHRSEQVETCLAMSVGRDAAGEWHGGGMMIQKIAGDETRGDTDEGWREAQALFSTLTPEELRSEEIAAPDLLFRLFHEGGVRMEPAQLLEDRCTCNEDRLKDTLAGMADESLREMVEPDGMLKVDCQFCARHYDIPIEAVTDAIN
ncbi:Hsp33 family molecular chaperone HslO [Henriciella aquimarina]|uniref:Hsp33 family molecular chaperone HslO n=1 Tax=Henriciella aquimarina TaxID=545261 RepID=UPI001EEF6FFE|nr:Hsp33 family molecular chaperone HslO [Henriciella aquimarina]